MRTLLPLLLAATFCVPSALAVGSAASVESVAAKPCPLVKSPVCWALALECNTFPEQNNLTCDLLSPLMGQGGPKGPCPDGEQPPCHSSANLATGGEASCTNYGVISQVTVFGHNHYCVGGSCDNEGILIFVGDTASCKGYGIAGVCVSDTCEWITDSSP